MQSSAPVEYCRTLHIMQVDSSTFSTHRFYRLDLTSVISKIWRMNWCFEGIIQNSLIVVTNSYYPLRFVYFTFPTSGNHHISPVSPTLKSVINHDHVMNPYRDFLSCRRRFHSAWIRSSFSRWSGDRLVLIFSMLVS